MAEEHGPNSLTERLMKKFFHNFQAATQHDFLTAAGNGKLPADTLCKWLGQDIIYTRAYIRFIGSLLSRIQVPEKPGVHETSLYPMQLRIMNLMIDSLTNIQREIKFFDDTISKYSLNIQVSEETGYVKPEPVTQAYADLFDSFNSPSRSLLEGLVTLWATEYAYLTAWRWAGSHTPSNWQQLVESESLSVDQRNAMRALWEAFIPNWTSPEFGTFVEECRKEVDELWELLTTSGDDQLNTSDSELLYKCERIFENNMRLEEGFWPS